MTETNMRQELAQLGSGAHALAMQLLGDRDDAFDAVQDAMAQTLATPERYDPRKGALKPWFMRVVRNRCIDMLRGRRAADTAPDEVVHPGPGPEAAVERDQRAAGVRRALKSLKPAQREIVVLRDYLDLSYADIAAVLDVAQGTVMSRLHRARLALKEAVESDDG
ncbi:MAG: sigma-70 family RNA polymerase sigma factor [Pseudomonadota bacterium]